jgi:predicted permease
MFARLLAQPRSWFRAVLRRNRLEAEMEAELACHLEALTADLVRGGETPAEAARQARIALGPVLKCKEGMRASRGLRWWDELGADLRFGLRMLRKSPGFTAVAVSSLALAIGANTAIFSIAKQFLFDRLNVPHPEQLRLLGWTGDEKVASFSYRTYLSGAQQYGMKSESFSYPVFRQLQATDRSMEGLIAFSDLDSTATLRGSEKRLTVEAVSGGFYGVLGVRPQLGRAIQPSDDGAPGSGAVAVISEGFWEREFGRSPAVLGQSLHFRRATLTIVGVNPRGFTGAQNVQRTPDVFIPMSMYTLVDPWGSISLSPLTDPTWWSLEVMGRMRPGAKQAEVRAALDTELAAAVRSTMSLKAGETIPRMVLADGSRGLHQMDSASAPIYLLLAITGLVVLLACTNIANLLLARGAQRQREMSVRLAMGAGRGRVLRQLLTESLLLATLGGAGGLLLGYLGTIGIPKLLSSGQEQEFFQIHFDWGMCAFAGAITVLTGLLFGLAPAWSASRSNVSSNLKESAQTTTRRRRGLGGKALVGFQIALSTLLVIVAGLFIRTLIGLNYVDPGFRTDHQIVAVIEPPPDLFPTRGNIAIFQRLEQTFAALPGVESVAAMGRPWPSQGWGTTSFATEADRADPSKAVEERRFEVGNTFFPVLGVPIVAGRGFGPQDTATSPKVAVINQSLARKRFPNGNPVGQRFNVGDAKKDNWIQVVGICADTHDASLRIPPAAQFFVPYEQNVSSAGLTFAIRTHLPAATIIPTLRRTVAQVSPNLPTEEMYTSQELVHRSMIIERTLAALTAGFGVLALALACVGIYGIMAYSVANRRNEIGIRLALGAQPAQVRGMILRESTRLAVGGIVVGMAAALALTRLVKVMLYGIGPDDPLTLTAGVLVLLAVALAASWIPARRAASVQPMEALRHE